MEHQTGKDPNAGVDANISKIIAVSVFASVLAIASMTGRFTARKMNRQKWKADDCWIAVAVVFILADSACYLAGIRYGFGRHVHTVDRNDIFTFFRIAWATFLLYGCAITAVKVSVLLFYRRMFPTRTIKILLIVLSVLSTIWFLLITLFSIFQCMPVRKAWDPTVPGKCIPHLDIFIGMQATNIFLDIAVLCLPISAVMDLNISRSRRIAVAGIFSLGGLSIIFAAVRLAVLVQNKNQTDITCKYIIPKPLSITAPKSPGIVDGSARQSTSTDNLSLRGHEHGTNFV
ncbi:hypothetical protein P170DRAFT_478283 [Aspergillus steynii IBT 23096]|uniref:Rhodopsin domain-containing protein n=1 Tax=Aspergillus steynii IBT 23096 TaxID=1392250 RepID=A0A2I2G3I1_9EURO|nr:uncharacterized protein P170DRAFT_478283 [Aspergillus steynii IBT 23096]PLB47435.1 hypothetical protein P170DRAFT_478283 [Aspergillus steynii IBT 23096]